MAGLYALGSNGSGQLGIGHKEDVSVPKPVQMETFEEQGSSRYSIRAGGNHTLLLSSTGILYGIGDDSTGAYGVSTTTSHSRNQVKRVQYHSSESNLLDESKVLFCAATWEATIVVKADINGHATMVYSFGTGNKGELGLGDFVFFTSKSVLINLLPPQETTIVDLAASVSHVVVVLSNGEVYGWGNGRKGQLGEPAGIINSPRRIAGVSFPALRAVCGREFTYLVGSSESGKHLVLGQKMSTVKMTAPPHVKNWKDLGASWGSIHVLKNDGSMVAWGRNDHGQLGAKDLPRLSEIAVGSEHVVALNISGDALAWGWGEHGNCGPRQEGDNFKERWSTIVSSHHLPADCRIISIGAGCATSWTLIGT